MCNVRADDDTPRCGEEPRPLQEVVAHAGHSTHPHPPALSTFSHSATSLYTERANQLMFHYTLALTSSLNCTLHPNPYPYVPFLQYKDRKLCKIRPLHPCPFHPTVSALLSSVHPSTLKPACPLITHSPATAFSPPPILILRSHLPPLPRNPQPRSLNLPTPSADILDKQERRRVTRSRISSSKPVAADAFDALARDTLPGNNCSSSL